MRSGLELEPDFEPDLEPPELVDPLELLERRGPATSPEPTPRGFPP